MELVFDVVSLVCFDDLTVLLQTRVHGWNVDKLQDSYDVYSKYVLIKWLRSVDDSAF